MQLGLVTYNLAKDWDLDTIIEKCAERGFAGVELRTTHAHGVEVSLSAAERADVKRRFADSPVALVGLGSVFEYHAVDPDDVRRNIEGTKEYVKLAADVGAGGVKVRPNGLQVKHGVPKEKTLDQIGAALRECAEFAQDYGVAVRMEVHGQDTSDPPNMRHILHAADHPNAFACWNSNPGEVKNGSVRENFDLLAQWIGLVHISDLCQPSYPWRELLGLLHGQGYTGFCLAEAPESPEPERIMCYYRALWDAYLELAVG